MIFRLRQLHNRKVRMEAVGVIVNKSGDTITIEKKEGDEECNTTSTAVGTTPTLDEIHQEDEVEDMSENESEGTQPEEVICHCYPIKKIPMEKLDENFVSYGAFNHGEISFITMFFTSLYLASFVSEFIQSG